MSITKSKRQLLKAMPVIAFKTLLLVSAYAANSFAQEESDAQIPVVVNVAATVKIDPPAAGMGTGAEGAVTANTARSFDIKLIGFRAAAPTSASHRQNARTIAPASLTQKRGNAALSLHPQQYQNAAITLHSLSGRQILSGKASASKGGLSISRSNVPAGVYLLSVKGTNGGAFTTRLTHSGGRFNINVVFNGEAAYAPHRSAEALVNYGQWTITVTAPGHITQSEKFSPSEGTNPQQSFTLTPITQTTPADFTETITVSGTDHSFNMVYIPGGAFRLGCEGSGCPANTAAVDAAVSPYFIGAATVTTALWRAVMGTGDGIPASPGGATWYEALEFACKLSQLTGRNYRMMTEAEFEFAAKNHRASLTIGTTEEWAYNTWSATHMAGTDPVGPGSGTHNQKTRRNAQGTSDNITGRLIRSIEGIGPALRLTLSANGGIPPSYVHPCELHAPTMGGEPENSYRDMRWVTGSDARWRMGSTDLRIWADGTARLGTTNGQWFTSNNINLVFVPSPGQGGGFGPAPTLTRYSYIFLNESDGSFLSTGMGGSGRMTRGAADHLAKPTVTGLMSGEELARSQPDFETLYKMVDMVNMPQSIRGQDSRLLDGPDSGWMQINTGSTHHYRKDVDPDEFRFIVSGALLANGSWFTVNNTFLRITYTGFYQNCTWGCPGGGFGCGVGNMVQTCVDTDRPLVYEVDYLYNITSSGQFFHNSFMGYERGDMRVFTKMANSDSRIAAIASQCQRCVGEIPKGQGVSMYGPGGFMEDVGASTFVPAPCPAGGC
ncbi:MAG: SUMF1/EgtB/PvdO family nonheme iron enzyme [Chitinispirillia bacterium]|nr:SUMF1/EgtB/PvdO family nonheme iron enzyme [Chitinispirillia bacterium]